MGRKERAGLRERERKKSKGLCKRDRRLRGEREIIGELGLGLMIVFLQNMENSVRMSKISTEIFSQLIGF